MSLLKLGILIAVVVAVLPADREQQAALYDKAATAVHWTATFCDRNGTTCDQAGVIWSAFVEKAKFGAAMAYELVTKDSEGAPATAQTVRYNVIEPGVDLTPRGTLRAEDLEPVWRGAMPAQPNSGRI
ncbi:DUF5330 domain-containing protein [Hyphomicrobium sulfonivorans]|uniref:DUF5330 domain-containing protein n=1 Tax=Hyphomicrobium sulfonivorans TaxID=121290 RepID=UPI001570DED4|nr:DUF5330 domain-containing protein [Hyphomicrobium sulfonivorans]MBI1651360.1 DUF5330 domain-containing protein [Hyphomicrobium sulfonivorans]